MVLDSPNYSGPPDCAPALVVVAGQSNALGYTLGPDDLPPHLRGPIARVMIWDSASHAFTPLQAGVNTGTANNPGAWGPEAQLAFRWSQDHPCGDLYVVKHARGETGLARDPAHSDWSPSSTGEVWEKASAEVEAAKATLKGQNQALRVGAVFWMQGETDAEDAVKAAAYQQNLSNLIMQIRARWGDEQTMIYIGQIDDPSAFVTGWDKVRQAQASVAASAPGVRLTDTDALPRQPSDGVHLTGAGQADLGDRFYVQYGR